MIRDFFAWWIGQLTDLVPAGWRRFGALGSAVLVVAPVRSAGGSVEAAQVSLRRNGRETALGRFPLAPEGLAGAPHAAGRPVILQLPEAEVLGKTIVLPLAAERELDQVLAFEMERETPFSLGEIFWSRQIEERDRRRGQLLVRLLLVPRTNLAVLLAALARAGITPHRAEIASGPDRGRYLPLDAEDGHRHALTGSSRLRWPAVAGCVALALAVIIVPFLRQSATLADLDTQVAAGRRAAAEAQRLRSEIATLTGAVNLIEGERDQAGRPLETLATLTRLLPNDTYLTEVQQRQHKVTLAGRSAGASRLIGAIAASERLRNPAFAAPVTRIEAIDREVFTITAEIAQ